MEWLNLWDTHCIWVACHSVKSRPQTQRLSSSPDSEDCFPLFPTKTLKAIHESSESCSTYTATLSHLLKKDNPPPHTHTNTHLTLLPAELHRATDVMKGHRDYKQTHFLPSHWLVKGRQDRRASVPFLPSCLRTEQGRCWPPRSASPRREIISAAGRTSEIMRKEVAGETKHHLLPPVDCRTQQLGIHFVQHKLWGRFLLRYNPLALIKDGGQTHVRADGRMLTASIHLQ